MSETQHSSHRLLGFAATAAILGAFAVWASLPTVEPSMTKNTSKVAFATASQVEPSEEPHLQSASNLCAEQGESGCADSQRQTGPLETLSFAQPTGQVDLATDETISRASTPEGTVEMMDIHQTAEIAPEVDNKVLAELSPAAGTESTNMAKNEPPKPRAEIPAQNSTENSYFLVIGSFLNSNLAKNRLKKFAGWKPHIRQKRLNGRMFHRVLLGPYDKSTLKNARARIIDSGITDNWAMRAPQSAKAQLALMELPDTRE